MNKKIKQLNNYTNQHNLNNKVTSITQQLIQKIIFKKEYK